MSQSKEAGASSAQNVPTKEEEFTFSHISSPGLDLTEMIINYVLAYAAVHAQEDGRLVDVYVHRKDIAAATGASRSHVGKILTTKLSHVASPEGGNSGWGIYIGTYAEFLDAVAFPPPQSGGRISNASRESAMPTSSLRPSQYLRLRGTNPRIYDGTT